MDTPNIPYERPETLALVWLGPPASPPAARPRPTDYSAESALAVPEYTVDRSAFEAVQAAAGWQMPPEQWAQLIGEWVPGTMTLLRVDGVAVAAACALQRTDGWIELAWVAVVPAFRGQGLGRQVCAALLARVLELGHFKLFGSTQDTRRQALRIYFDLGFVPVFRAEKVARWQAICAAIGHPFAPVKWGWPAARR